MAVQDWSSVVTRMPPPRPTVVADSTVSEALEREWIVKTMPTDAYYSVNRTTTQPGEDGRPETREEPVHFHFLATAYGSSRPHLMPTFLSADDTQLAEPLALRVQFFDINETTLEVPEGTRVTFAEADPEWLTLSDIAPFADMQHRLFCWDRVEARGDLPGCLLWSDVRRHTCVIPLMAPACPTLTVFDALVNTYNWRSVECIVTHTTLNKIFDGRQATTAKFYYQCLLDLRRTLPFAGGQLRSMEPVNYYKLLLRGVSVKAGTKNRDLVILMNKHKDENKLPIPLPPPFPARAR